METTPPVNRKEKPKSRPRTIVWDQTNMREFLENFYRVHNPEKLSTIDLILERYRGHEGELFEHLSEKYDVADFFASAGIELTEDIDESNVDDNFADTRPVPDAPSLSAPVSSLQRANTATSSSMAEDPSTRIGSNSGGNGTSSSSSTSSGSATAKGGNGKAIAQSMTPQSHHKQQRLDAAFASAEQEKQQMLATIQTLKSQLASLKRDNDVVRNNLVAVVDKETGLSRELQAAGEQARALEKSRQELKAQLRAALGQRDSKHAQLEETILLNHRLGGQVRYLASKAFETMDTDKDKSSGSSDSSSSSSDSTSSSSSSSGSSSSSCIIDSSGSSNGGGGDAVGKKVLHLPEFTALEKKIADAVSASCDKELKAVLARLGGSEAAGTARALEGAKVKEEDAGLLDIEGGEGGAEASGEGHGQDKAYVVLKQQVLLAAQARTIEVLQTLYMASRVEMRLSTRQNGLCEQRISEQQMVIEGLQNKLSGIANELDTASGSADHLRRQINETSSDLASHKLMLTMSERMAQTRGSELADARDEIASLQDALSASAAARQDLVQLCAVHTAGAEAKAAEFVRGLSERVLLEREEFISRWSGVSAPPHVLFFKSRH